ncbi:type VI secretion system baseplate subunit TssE [Halomonadaceae bacterium KBTZ08]
MQSSDARNGLQLSLLDRLLDEGALRPSLAQVRQSVRRDLEWLLNARRCWIPRPSEYRELSCSVLTYGLPDFTVMELSTEDGRQWLCDEVKRTIVQFEPRLTQVEVVMKDTEAPMDRFLRLRIEAVLLVEPVPQQVAFDSELEPVSLSVTLKECA